MPTTALAYRSFTSGGGGLLRLKYKATACRLLLNVLDEVITLLVEEIRIPSAHIASGLSGHRPVSLNSDFFSQGIMAYRL